MALAIALVSRWVCEAMACAKSADNSEENLFKNAKGRLYCILICLQVCVGRLSCKSRICLRGKSLIENCQPFFFETEFCPATLPPTLGFAQWPGFEN